MNFQRNSQEHKDACEFWELFLSTKQKMLEDPKGAAADDAAESKSKIVLKVGKVVSHRRFELSFLDVSLLILLHVVFYGVSTN